MFVGSMIYNQVHDEFEISLFCFCQKLFHVFHGTVFGIYFPVSADIIAVVKVGGAVHRG